MIFSINKYWNQESTPSKMEYRHRLVQEVKGQIKFSLLDGDELDQMREREYLIIMAGVRWLKK